MPKGVHTVTPSLCFEDAAFAIQFYEKAFGAKELYRLAEPSGQVGHAQIRIGDSTLMVSDEYPGMAVLSAKKHNGSPKDMQKRWNKMPAASKTKGIAA